MKNPIIVIENWIKAAVNNFAKGLNRVTGGKLHPDVVTILGALMHLPITLMIALDYQWWLAAILLAFFGLFDALDGALARAQGRQSAWGMLLDSVTDRLKEAVLYIGIGYSFALSDQPWTAVLAVWAIGVSIIVSYTRAAGDVSMLASAKKFNDDQINKAFRGGLLSFQLRILIIIIGLLSGQLVWAVLVIAILASITVCQRLFKIRKALK